MNEQRIVIIGGGISGLSAAYFLTRKTSDRKLPLKITVLEASERCGGVLRTLYGQDFHIEAGADAFDGKDPAVLDLCKALGIGNDLLPCESTFGRALISKNKDLLPLDPYFSDPRVAFKGRGLSLGGRMRLLGEFFVPQKKNDADESIAAFIRRRLGEEVLTAWGEPLTRGILMAEAEDLSLREYFPHWQKMEREYGSISRALLSEKKKVSPGGFYTIRGGMERLLAALLGSLKSVDLKTRAEAAVLKQGKTWEVHLRDGRVISADIVCVALPAPEAAKLLGEAAAPLSAALMKIRYDPIAAVNMVFRREELPGSFSRSGFIVPSREKKWPFSGLKVIGRTEEGKGIRLRAFISGVFQPEVLGKEDDLVQREVLRCLADEWSIRALPSWISTERYPRALAQYETGHALRVSRIEKLLEDHPGLFLAGNGFHGFGITDCVRSARAAVDQIAQGFLRPLAGC